MNRTTRMLFAPILVGALAACAQFFAEDYEAAYASEREAYEHMFMTGTALAAAIAGQFPAEFPTTPMPSDTAMTLPSSSSPAVLVGLVLAALAALGLTRRAIEVQARTR